MTSKPLSSITAISPVILKRSYSSYAISPSSKEFLVQCMGDDGLVCNKRSAKACRALADELDEKHGIRAITVTHDPRVEGAGLSLLNASDAIKARKIFQGIVAENLERTGVAEAEPVGSRSR